MKDYHVELPVAQHKIDAIVRPIDTPIESLVNLPSWSEVSITDGFHKCFK
jgi:hypothetical protein